MNRPLNLFPASIGVREGQPVYGHFVANEWVAGNEDPIEVVAPATGQRFAWLARGGKSQIDAAVAAARASLDGAWGQLTAVDRGRLMLRFASLIRTQVERLALLEARDTGKPISQAANDIQTVARYFEFYGGAADKVHGEVIPYLNGYSVSVMREPMGVTAHITPWNYPAQMFGRTLSPALAMGNATVLKPAEDACVICLELAQLAMEAGFPEGAINVVTGLGEEAGAPLACHHGIDFLTFTGSPEVGTVIQESAAIHHVPVVLELGGKSPQLVFADADIAIAAKTICTAITQNAGQTCSAGSRVLVERSIFDEFIAILRSSFESLRIGTPEEDCDLGPVINETQRARIQKYIDTAIKSGVPILASTPLPANLPAGYFVAPTVFGPVGKSEPLVLEEIFGPVLTVQIFDNEAEAIELANGTEFGLVAGVWTANGARQQRLAKKIISGQVFVNCYGAGGGVELPFGGTKRSGFGREKGLMALHEVSNTKTVVLWHG